MCQICESGRSVLLVAFSLCGPKEMEQFQKEIGDLVEATPILKAYKEKPLEVNDIPAFVFAVLTNAIARHCFEQRIGDPTVIFEAIRIQWNKLYLMKQLGLEKHDSETERKLRDYES